MIAMMDLGTDVIAVQVDGKIERADLNRLSEEIERKAASGGRLRVYAEIGDLSFFNLLGISQDLKSWASRKHLVDLIDKAAVVTDSSLVKQGMQYKDRVPASLDIKLFSSRERDQARQWIAGAPGPA